MKKFYLSTALPYVNDAPHLGFALEIIQADVIARYHRLLGDDVFFLTGTDENSLKNVQAAEKEKISVKELVDRNAQKFYELKTALNLSFDDFIRTIETRHIKGAQKLWQACQKDIYKKNYQGLYCIECEGFYKENELENGLCPEHKIKPVLVAEENYFFRLSNYQTQLKRIIEREEVKIIPNSRKNEVLSFIQSGLEDFCISRKASRGRGWGIPVPGDSTQVIWTWFDALSNYINALGYDQNSKKFQEWWQENENKLHIIGKGISRFHCVYWPAILLSAKLSLPKTIFIHGYLTVNGQKMSKSLGNVVDPFELVKKYGADPVRYFLLREIPAYEDGDFTEEKFKERYNADLANGLGNYNSRVLTLAQKIGEIEFNNTIIETGVKEKIEKTKNLVNQKIEEFKLNEAITAIWALIGSGDKYLNENEVWKISDPDKKSKKLANLLFVLISVAELLKPFLPQTSEKILSQLEVKGDKYKVKKIETLFPRI